MNILWFSWKDRSHPLAGGAEVVGKEMARRLAADGHRLIFVVGGYKGAAKQIEHPGGYTIVRVGNRASVYWQAYRYYREHLVGWADLVIDEVNTVPFFAKFYVCEPNILLLHQLCRRIWFYELPLPLSVIGYLIEPLYLRLLRDRTVITVSESTRQDLAHHGFHLERMHIISEGLEEPALGRLPALKSKASVPTMLSFGSMRAMKRTLHQIQAFELAKHRIPNLKLIIAGSTSGRYGQKVLEAISLSAYNSDITCYGPVSQKKKLALMRRSHLIAVTSVKEGWGLIISEAAGQGTPAVAYNVDGLRDSVIDHQTGLLTRPTPAALARAIIELLGDDSQYEQLRQAAWSWSRQLTFDNAYRGFSEVISKCAGSKRAREKRRIAYEPKAKGTSG